MRLTIIGLILLGLIAAVSAAVLVASLRAESLAETTKEAQTVEVMVAARDLEPMAIITSEDIEQITVAADEAPEGGLTSTVQVIGQITSSAILEGQVISRSRLLAEDAAVHLAATLPEGGRAMTIELRDGGIVSLLYPGCFVDVVASFRLPAKQGGLTGEIVSATLIQNVRVLGVGSRTIVDGEGTLEAETEAVTGRERHVVTVMVDPDQAETLQLALAHGTVSLAMRNPLDRSVSRGRGVLLSDMSDEIAARIAELAQAKVGAMPLTTPPADGTTELVTVDPEAPVDPVATADPEEPVTVVIEPHPLWSIRVLRGRVSETVNFPVEEEDEPEGDSDDT